MGRPALWLSTLVLSLAGSASVCTAAASAASPAKAPVVKAVDMDDPVAVGKADLKLYFGYNTVTDHSRWDAVLRSTRYYTRSYAAATKAVHPRPYNDAQWGLWKAHKAVMAVSVARVYDSAPPPTTPTVAYAEFRVTVVPQGLHNWIGPRQVHIVWASFQRSAPARGPWLISRLEVQ